MHIWTFQTTAIPTTSGGYNYRLAFQVATVTTPHGSTAELLNNTPIFLITGTNYYCLKPHFS